MKEYTTEELKKIMAPDSVKVPIVELTMPDAPNLIEGSDNVRLMLTVYHWNRLSRSSAPEGVLTAEDDGTGHVVNNESNIGFMLASAYGVQITNTNIDYNISVMIKVISGDVPVQFRLSAINENKHRREYINEFKEEPQPDGWIKYSASFSPLIIEPHSLSITLVTSREEYSGLQPMEPITNDYYFKNISLYEGDLNVTDRIPEDRIIAESFELSEILDSGKALKFWGMNAASFKFQALGINKDYRGYKIQVRLQVDDIIINLFAGVVETQTNQNHEDIITSFTCYDYLYRLRFLDFTDWWNAYEWKSTIGLNPRDFFTELAVRMPDARIDYLGYSITSGVFRAEGAKKPDLISKYGVITADIILEIIASNGFVYYYFDYDVLKLKILNPMDEGLHPHVGLYPMTGLHPYGGRYDEKYAQSNYISASYEPYKTELIDQVVMIDKDGNIVCKYDKTTEHPVPPSTYIGKNPFYISADYTMPEDYWVHCKNVYNRIKDIYFTPSKIQTVYDPRIETGDLIKVYTNKNIIYSYILNRNVKGIQAMFSTYTNKSDRQQTTPRGV